MTLDYETNTPAVHYEVHVQREIGFTISALPLTHDSEDSALNMMGGLAKHYYKVYLIKVERRCTDTLMLDKNPEEFINAIQEHLSSNEPQPQDR